MLTCTLCVWSAARGLVDWLYDQPGMGEHTINPIVGETNDGRVNDMWSNPVRPAHVREALEAAEEGPIAEGSVGAGTGTQGLWLEGGIGTSSRVLPKASAAGPRRARRNGLWRFDHERRPGPGARTVSLPERPRAKRPSRMTGRTAPS